jgi:propionyl-CoA carboxylase alpha chain
LFNY